MKTYNYKIIYTIGNRKTAVNFTSLEEVKKCLAFRELPLSDWRDVFVLDKDGNKIIRAYNINGEIFNDKYAKYDVCYILKSPLKNIANLSFTEKTTQEPETKEEEVEITDGDIEWIGDNIFHLVCEELIKTKGNTEHITLKFLSPEFIKNGWDNKSKFILSYKRVYPLDAVEKYLASNGRTVQDVFELWKQIAIKDYNNED